MIGKATLDVMVSFGLTVQQAAELAEAIERDNGVKPPRERRQHLKSIENFDLWWAAYPNKVGKGAAAAAYIAALGRTNPDELMGGLQRYIYNKPADREWCNPATWLQQDRWLDQPAARVIGHVGPRPSKPATEEGTRALLSWKAKKLQEEAENPNPLTKTQGSKMLYSLAASLRIPPEPNGGNDER